MKDRNQVVQTNKDFNTTDSIPIKIAVKTSKSLW
jgi:hypothetical protein